MMNSVVANPSREMKYMSIFENINFSLRGAISITSAAADESPDIRKTKPRMELDQIGLA